MEKLHTDILENILDRLPIESALRAKRVCRTWKILLRSKTDKIGFLFSESHYEDENEKTKLYYGDEYDPIRGKMIYNYSYIKLDKMLNGKSIPPYRYILGSCNGLVCFERNYGDSGHPFLICNPMTGEVVYVPQPDKSIARDSYPTHINGFGYCQATNEYKIVRMYYNGREKYHVLVYTIGGGGGWRSKASICNSPLHPSGVYANGALHWLFYTNINRIMAFDLEDEKFEFIDLSYFKDLRSDHIQKLLGGNNLYFVFSTLKYKPYATEIWAYKRETTNTTNSCDLKTNYNNKNSWRWIKEFRIEWEESFWNDMPLLQPLALTRNNEFLLRYACRTIYCYDLKTSTLHKLVDGFATGCNMVNVIPHANSIVSISSKGGEVQDHQ